MVSSFEAWRPPERLQAVELQVVIIACPVRRSIGPKGYPGTGRSGLNGIIVPPRFQGFVLSVPDDTMERRKWIAEEYSR
jgi:hypothetical protein